jgi:hypothetical protein
VQRSITVERLQHRFFALLRPASNFRALQKLKLKRVINLVTFLSLSSNLIASRAFLSTMHMRTTAAGIGVLIVGALLLALGGASESREIRNTWEAAVNKADLVVAIVGCAPLSLMHHLMPFDS